VEQELLTLPEHLSSPQFLVGFVLSIISFTCFVDRYLSFCTFSYGHCVSFVDRCLSFCTFSFGHCVFCRWLFVLLSFFFWPISCCLFFFNLSLFVFLYFFIWPMCCLFFFDIRILITSSVSSNSSFNI